MNSIAKFNNIEVRFNNNKSNLKDVALCCGLTKKKGDKIYIRWTDKGIKEKLNNILSCDSLPQHIVDEINNILQEIEETDDRNNIYISSWLAKRLATECKSPTAMEFKNWLITLDEAREQGKLVPSNNNITMEQVQNIISVSMTEVLKQILPTINEANKNVNQMAGLIHDQAEIYDDDREKIKDLIGLKPKNTQDLGKRLLNRERKYYNKYITSNTQVHKENKAMLLAHFGVNILANIHPNKYDEVIEYIDNMELVS